MITSILLGVILCMILYKEKAMAEDKVLKPKSFRIDDETADKFKQISASIGGNQQEALSKLIEAYEFQSGKAILTERKADIDQFETYVTAITRMFMGSLEDNQNLSETIRTEFDALLQSKDVTIQELRKKFAQANQQKEEFAAKAKTYSDENARLNITIHELKSEYTSKINDMQTMLLDKDSLNKTLTDSCNDLKEKMEHMKQSADQAVKLQKDFDMLYQTHEKTIVEQKQLKEQIEQMESVHQKTISDLQKQTEEALKRLKEQSQLMLEKQLLELEKKHHDEIQSLKAQKQEEIDKYQQKYFDLLEQMKEAQSVPSTQISESDNAET